MIVLKKIAGLLILSSLACGAAFAQTIVSKSPHSDAHKKLLANRAKSKDQIRLVEKTPLSTLSAILSRNLTSTLKAGTAKP